MRWKLPQEAFAATGLNEAIVFDQVCTGRRPHRFLLLVVAAATSAGALVLLIRPAVGPVRPAEAVPGPRCINSATSSSGCSVPALEGETQPGSN